MNFSTYAIRERKRSFRPYANSKLHTPILRTGKICGVDGVSITPTRRGEKIQKAAALIAKNVHRLGDYGHGSSLAELQVLFLVGARVARPPTGLI